MNAGERDEERNHLFERNISRIAEFGAPTLATELRSSHDSERRHDKSQIAGVRVDHSRDGDPVPVVNAADRQLWLASRYSPSNEATRLCETIPHDNLVVVGGIGAGTHIQTLIESRSPTAIVIVPEPAYLLRESLRHLDLSLWGEGSSVRMVDRHESILQVLLENFIPLYTEGVSACIPSGHRHGLPDCTAQTEDAFRSLLERVGSDLTAQRRFGSLWTRNCVLNLPYVTRFEPGLRFSGSVHIAAAGPTLETWISDGGIDGCEYLISTDTAAPSVAQAGRTSDVIVSIDPSPYSYHHLLCGAPRSTTWLIDACANPLLWRSVETAVPLGNSHPLLGLLLPETMRRQFPARSRSDVTTTAVTAATQCGAQEIHVVGADFGYPAAKTYCEGSYVPQLFHSTARRTCPTESLHYSFAHRSPEAARDATGVVRTPGLDRGADALRAISPPPGITVSLDNRSYIARRTGGVKPAEPPAIHTASAFLETPQLPVHLEKHLRSIGDELMTLRSEPKDVFDQRWSQLDTRERGLIRALIPDAVAQSTGSRQERLTRSLDHLRNVLGLLL